MGDEEVSCGKCFFYDGQYCRQGPPTRVDLDLTTYPAPRSSWWCFKWRSKTTGKTHPKLEESS